jgi:ATP-dependent DNA helicase RecG
LRGPGDIAGTRQSGMLDFKLADIVRDRPLVDTAKTLVMDILEKDPDLDSAENLRLKNFLQTQKRQTGWSKIS